MGDTGGYADVGSVLGATDSLQVDVEHLDNIGAYLKILADAVQSGVITRLDEAHRLAQVGGDVDPSAGGMGRRSALGVGYVEVEELSGREATSYQALSEGAKAAVNQLRQAANAIQRIADQYSTAEQRNGLNAVAFTQALASGS